MVEQAVAELPNECCGLLAGSLAAGVGTVTHCLPLVNAAASPTKYLSDPKSMLAAERAMTEAGVVMLAVYHSHPTTAPVPSATDRAMNYSESMLNLIISLAGGQPDVQAWWLTATDFEAGEWGFAEDSEA